MQHTQTVENWVEEGFKKGHIVAPTGTKWLRNALTAYAHTAVLAREKELREAVGEAFKETRDMQHDDEMHCGCLDYCEWVLNGKPEEALQN